MSDDYQPLAADEVTAELAGIVLGFYDVEGYGRHLSMGETRLCAAVVGTDEGCRERLSLGFPGLVAAVRLFETQGSAPLKAMVDDERAKAWAS